MCVYFGRRNIGKTIDTFSNRSCYKFCAKLTPTPAKTVLALMINFVRGTPAFVARLSQVPNLNIY